MLKEIIFDIDGVLIEADEEIRLEKYKSLFKKGLELVASKEYGGTKWLFPKLKLMYDIGDYEVDPSLYKLIEPDAAITLEKLSKKYTLHACSLAKIDASWEKLEAAGILKYFKSIMLKPLPTGDKSIAIVDDRYSPELGEGYYGIKYNYGQHKGQDSEASKTINSIKELL